MSDRSIQSIKRMVVTVQAREYESVRIRNLRRSAAGYVCQHMIDGTTSADSLAKDIFAECVEDANGHGGRQKYVVGAYASGETVAKAHVTIQVDAESPAEEDPDGVIQSIGEAPDRTGLTEQAMRHSETVMRTHVQAIAPMGNAMGSVLAAHERLAARLESIIEKQSEQVNDAWGQRVDWFMKLQELADRKAERDALMLRELSKNESKDQIAKRLFGLVDKVGTRLLVTGKTDGKKDPITRREAVIMGMVGNIMQDKARLAKLAEVLGDDFMPVMEVVGELSDVLNATEEKH